MRSWAEFGSGRTRRKRKENKMLTITEPPVVLPERLAEPHIGDEELDQLAINTIRTLCMDAVQQANSGHPGTPMGLAPVAYCLWQRFLRFDPEHPLWPNRDRFVLSVGHASTLLYALLHLTGVKAVNPKYEVLGDLSVPLDDLKNFRQLGSRCPGHPEYRWTSGVEATTGPLGQGVAMTVGMAIAARWKTAHFSRPAFDLFTYNVYALCGDGCIHGRHFWRSRIAGRSSKALKPVLDLRQQQNHD
jgi:transketolase